MIDGLDEMRVLGLSESMCGFSLFLSDSLLSLFSSSLMDSSRDDYVRCDGWSWDE